MFILTRGKNEPILHDLAKASLVDFVNAMHIGAYSPCIICLAISAFRGHAYDKRSHLFCISNCTSAEVIQMVVKA